MWFRKPLQMKKRKLLVPLRNEILEGQLLAVKLTCILKFIAGSLLHAERSQQYLITGHNSIKKAYMPHRFPLHLTALNHCWFPT